VSLRSHPEAEPSHPERSRDKDRVARLRLRSFKLRFDCEPNSDDANDDDRLFGHSYENICRTCPAESRSINSTRYHPSQSRREYTLYGKE
jgi:hypothetical protein